jgi:hypothetical protein
MVLDYFLDLGLHVRGDIARRDLLEKSTLRSCQMCAKFGFPFRDFFNGDRVELRDDGG